VNAAWLVRFALDIANFTRAIRQKLDGARDWRACRPVRSPAFEFEALREGLSLWVAEDAVLSDLVRQ